LENTWLFRLTCVGIGMAVLVVILGAFTRLVDAGLGCPDWPGCYGFLVVPETAEEIATAEQRFPDAPVEVEKAWWEMVHRYFATALGGLVLAIALIAARNPDKTAPRKLPYFLLGLVILQGAFGAWTVTLKLWPQVVTAHLLGGFATLSLLWLLALRLRLGRSWIVPSGIQRLAKFGLVILVLQIALGGWVSSNYAALACPDFPTCHGEWVPEMDLSQGFDLGQTVGPNYLGGLLESEARIAIQFMHRMGAVLALLVLGFLTYRLVKEGSSLGPALGLLLVGQITLGILNVILVLPLALATAHNAIGALLLLAVVTVNYRATVRRDAVE